MAVVLCLRWIPPLFWQVQQTVGKVFSFQRTAAVVVQLLTTTVAAAAADADAAAATTLQLER